MFDRLRSLDLPSDDFAIYGSGPLAIRQMIDDPTDLDVICRGPAWDRVRELGFSKLLEDGTLIYEIDNGRLTFGNSWAIGDFDVDALIDDAESIDGLPFVRLEHVIAYKRLRGSARDVSHLELLERSGLL